MVELTKELIEAMADETISCLKRGDTKDAEALYFLLLDKIQIKFLEPSLKDPKFMAKLIKDSNSTDEVVQYQAMMLLKYFLTRNLIPKETLKLLPKELLS